MMLADEGSGLLEGIDDIHGEVSGIDLGGTRHPVAAPIAPALASGGDHERQLRLRPRLLPPCRDRRREKARSEEHTPELQSLMRISYAVFCLKKKNKQQISKLL